MSYVYLCSSSPTWTHSCGFTNLAAAQARRKISDEGFSIPTSSLRITGWKYEAISRSRSTASGESFVRPWKLLGEEGEHARILESVLLTRAVCIFSPFSSRTYFQNFISLDTKAKTNARTYWNSIVKELIALLGAKSCHQSGHNIGQWSINSWEYCFSEWSLVIRTDIDLLGLLQLR